MRSKRFRRVPRFDKHRVEMPERMLQWRRLLNRIPAQSAAWLCCSALLLLRLSLRLTHADLWAEDGAIFLEDAQRYGWSSLFMSTAGVGQLVPRALTLAIVHIFPAAAWPVATNAVAGLVAGACFASFAHKDLSWLYRDRWFAIAGALLLCLPASAHETFGNLVNLPWILLFAGALIFARDLNRDFTRCEVFVIAAIAFTGGMALCIVPIAILRLWRLHAAHASKHNTVATILIIGAATVMQAAVLFHGAGSPMAALAAVGNFTLSATLLQPLLGRAVVAFLQHHPPLLITVAIAFLALFVAAARQRREASIAVWMILAGTTLFAFCLLKAHFATSASLLPPSLDVASRLALFPSLCGTACWVWLAAGIHEDWRTGDRSNRLAGAMALCGLLLLGSRLNPASIVLPQVSLAPQWSTAVNAGACDNGTAIAIAPDGWRSHCLPPANAGRPPFTIESSVPFRLQLYYSTTMGFSEEKSVRVEIPASVATIPDIAIADSDANQMRVDPPPFLREFALCFDGPSEYVPIEIHEARYTSRGACIDVSVQPDAKDPFIAVGRVRQHAQSRTSLLASPWPLLFLITISGLLLLTRVRCWPRLEQLADRACDRISQHAHQVAIAAIISCGMAYAFITPPNGVPDETTHLAGPVHVFERLFRHVDSDTGGIDYARQYAGFVDAFTFSAHTMEEHQAALEAPLVCDVVSHPTLHPAVPYYYHLYALPSLAFAVTCAVKGSFGTFLLAARLLNLLLATLLVSVGVRFAVRGKISLLCIALLPMTLAQLASVSADSLALSSSLAFIGLASGLLATDSPSRSHYIWLGITAVLLTFSKPGAAWPAALFMAFYELKIHRRWWSVIAFGALPLVVHLASSVIARVPVVPLLGVNPEENAFRLLHRPGLFFDQFIHSFAGGPLEALWTSLIGCLGWLDVQLPIWVYIYATAIILASAWANAETPRLAWPTYALFLGLAIASVVAIALPLYMIWTPPEATHVLGLQGRYFIPTVAFALVFFSTHSRPFQRLIIMSMVLTLPLLTLIAIQELTERYFVFGR